MIQRLKSIPDWGWLLSVIVFVLLFGWIESLHYPANAPTTPFKIAVVMSGFFIYMFPGWRLGRFVEKRAGKAWWGEYAALAILLAWVGIAWLIAKVSVEMGY